ncbi:MAG: extracellular solute-binding protein [Candidatus Omnitrophica bacterium]|nr:extracellular solute-binding protein [Candidatus Omnitrophota bacterium]MDD5592080.1 extracellular solute-binding protein [Candidatus Omnitrophota bacterium]
MKRICCAFLFVFCSFLCLAGCVPQQSDKYQTTLTVWHWMTDREEAFQELAKRYEASSGVKVNFELYAPSDAYAQKVRAAAQGQNLPDIFGVLGETRDFASFIKAGHVLGLTSYMDADSAKWRNTFFSKALAVNGFSDGNSYGIKPGIYGVPIDIMTIQMVYNKDLFKKLGLNPNAPPETFAQFLEIGKKISATNRGGSGGKEAKMQGLVSGWGEIWMIDCLANNYAFNIMGEDKVLATIKGEIPYTDPDWVRVLTLFKEMQDSGVLYNGLVTMANKNAEQLFANGRAVFAFNGSWCVNVYKSMNPRLDYAAMLLPKASEKFPVSIWGGAGSSFMVSAKSKNKEEAVNFLKWLTDRSQQAYLAQTTSNPPANKEALSEIPPVLAQFADDMEYATHPNTWGVSESPQVIETFNRGIQSIIIGEKSPEQVAQETQKIKEKELAKKKR